MMEVDVSAEIADLNTAYVLLAQKLLRSDKAAAMLRLGVCRESADFLLSLSVPQILKLATSSFLLCSLRSGARMEAVVAPGHDRHIQQAHLSIVLAASDSPARQGVAA